MKAFICLLALALLIGCEEVPAASTVSAQTQNNQTAQSSQTNQTSAQTNSDGWVETPWQDNGWQDTGSMTPMTDSQTSISPDTGWNEGSRSTAFPSSGFSDSLNGSESSDDDWAD